MDIVRLFLFTARLLAPTTDADVELRWDLVTAIASVTDDETERFLLAKIARFESNYRADVADCRVRGALGEVGPWQVLPRSAAEREVACATLEGSARLALARIRESRLACRHLPIDEQLAVYAAGRCSSMEGRRLSRVRWPRRGEISP
jgi:hypothetical protein